jgi:hypothetical protein
MSSYVSAAAGFLLAVLWFDLMFDVQVARARGQELPEQALASIAGYYGRVTTAARPMNRLVAAVMLAMLATIVAQLADAQAPAWVASSSLGLASAAIARAATHTVPSAVRLGTRADSSARQSALARGIYRDHVACAAAIATVLVLQLAFA